MKAKFGIFCMILGAVLVLGALGLAVYNQNEAAQAQQISAAVLPELMEKIRQEKSEAVTEPPTQQIPESLRTPEDVEMAEMVIDGERYIGCLSVPGLELELPVMSDWSYPQLRKAPCRYYGTALGGDLVLMAHNYARHFGYISQLKAGDPVYFTDADGNVHCYEVAAVDVLAPTAVEEMTAGDFDLTLFTCTYGGKSRVTVFCDRVEI